MTYLCGNKATLEQAIDLKERSYYLLQWAREANSKGLIVFERFAIALSQKKEGIDWIQGKWIDLPKYAKPAKSDDIEYFWNMYHSFIVSSFDVVDEFGSIFKGMYVPVVSTWELDDRKPSNFRAKKVTPEMKEAADQLMKSYLLALKSNVNEAQALEAIIEEKLYRELAYAAYGYNLIERMNGIASLGSMVLWRRFAWRNGGPIKGFNFSLQDVLEAENAVSTFLNKT